MVASLALCALQMYSTLGKFLSLRAIVLKGGDLGAVIPSCRLVMGTKETAGAACTHSRCSINGNCGYQGASSLAKR